jgi:hypothetical protein
MKIGRTLGGPFSQGYLLLKVCGQADMNIQVNI